MLPDRSVLIGQKLAENAKIQKFKCDIFGWFSSTVELLNHPVLFTSQVCLMCDKKMPLESALMLKAVDRLAFYGFWELQFPTQHLKDVSAKILIYKYLITVHNGKLDFIWLAKKDNLMLLNQFKTFSINLNAQHVNGMTPFDLALSTVIRYSRVVLCWDSFQVVRWGQEWRKL